MHGGPWHRDQWGYNPYHQWVANRGYAIVMVEFRGSTGFGKSFANAADHEWGGKMHDDVLDAVAWAIGSRDRRSGNGSPSWAAATAATPYLWA
ncbi:MAG: prolyl oligopeptidase family serine peptidase [Candidatus Eisenbacteria bacterium]